VLAGVGILSALIVVLMAVQRPAPRQALTASFGAHSGAAGVQTWRNLAQSGAAPWSDSEEIGFERSESGC
jgi:hypothetical protein